MIYRYVCRDDENSIKMYNLSYNTIKLEQRNFLG